MAVPPPFLHMTPAIDKKVLRAQLRAARDRFASETSSAILVPDAFAERLTGSEVIATYSPIGSEADPTQLAAAAAAKGCMLALPHVIDRATPIRFLAWHIGDELITGPFGLRQPKHDSPEVVPDIILTPLLGFDARLNRLGQGAGHYDRAFARFSDAWRVGVAWSVQQVPALPAEQWDVPLHAIVTERGMRNHQEMQ